MSVPPLYRVVLRMATDIVGQPSRRWTNVLYCPAPSAGAAAIAGANVWVQYLRDASRERVWCYEVYATDNSPSTDNFFVEPVAPGSQRGTLVTPSGEPYLPKTCVSVTIPVASSRPSRKFFRPGLYDADVANGVSLVGVLPSAIQDAFDSFISVAEGFWCDPDGQPWNTGVRLRLTTREFGREATADVPVAPPLG